MASSVKWLAKRAPSPDSADRVNSFSRPANSSPVMSPPLPADGWRQACLGRHYHICEFEKVFRTEVEDDAALLLLFRGFRHHRQRRSCKPAVEKCLQPGTLGHVMDRAIGEVVMALPRARQFEPCMAPRGPAMHHRVGHVGMKLEAKAMLCPERLHRKVAALGQQFGADGKFKSLAVPVVDMIRPARADREPRRRRAAPVITDLHAAFRMRSNLRAELHSEHLRAQANSQERPLLPQRHGDPVDLLANEIIGVVCAHRAAEYDRAGMAIEPLGTVVDTPSTHDTLPVSKRPQRIADPAGR